MNGKSDFSCLRRAESSSLLLRVFLVWLSQAAPSDCKFLWEYMSADPAVRAMPAVGTLPIYDRGDGVARVTPCEYFGWISDVGSLGSGNSIGDGPPAKKAKAKAGPKKVKKAKAAGQVVKAIQNLKKTSTVKGKGGFFSDVWNSGKTLLGQGLHKGIDFLSNRAKGLVQSLVGHGDYQMSGTPVQYNSLYAGASVAPKFGNGGENGNIVQHRESLGMISSSVGFARTSFTINPGLSTFPWLSRIAPAWQRWKPHGAIVEWIPRVPDINVNSGGTVVMSSRYDLTTAAPLSVQEAEIAWGAITGRPMDKMAMPIECKNSLNPTNVLNVRFGALPAGANAQFFDHCIVDICTFGQAGVVNIGEVFVTFEFEFLMPTSETITNSTISSYVGFTANTTANPYGTTGWTVRGSSAFTPTVTQAAGSLTIDFAGNPLPMGSTWMVSFVLAEAGGNVTTQASLALGADLALYTPVFKNAAGADVGAISSAVPSLTEEFVTTFRVTGATGAQTLLYTAVVLAGGATGFLTFTLTPIVSTLTIADQHMRHRFPKLFEMSDMLEDLRSTQISLTSREDEYERRLARFAREDEFKETVWHRADVLPLPERVMQHWPSVEEEKSESAVDVALVA